MFKICSDLDNCPCTLERKVNTNERDTFTEVLKDLAVTCQLLSCLTLGQH